MGMGARWRRGYARPAIAVVIAVVAALGCSSSAWAATYTVTSSGDSGPGSLREVIEKEAGTGDTVAFAASLDGQTIDLTSGPIPIENGLTVEGPGASKLTIDGGNEHLLFVIATEEAVSVSGLTFAHGHGQAGVGGAIAQTGGSLTVSDSAFVADSVGGAGNASSGSDHGEGGAIYSGGGSLSLSVRGSSFTQDSAGGAGGTGGNSGSGNGGAIYYAGSGSLTVSGSSFIGNSAGGEGGKGTEGNSGLGEGGAIYDGGENSLEVSGSTFTGNSAGGNGGTDGNSGLGNGGAIYYEGVGSLEVSDSTFSGNSAGGDGGKGDNSGLGNGGAIEAGGSGSLTISGSTFSGNSAGGAGGDGNGSGEGFGGAISSYSGSSQSVVNSTLFDNTAGGAEGEGTPSGRGFGGAIDATSPLAVEGVTIDGNAVGGQPESAGSGIHGAGKVTAKATIVSGNTGAANCDAKVESSSYSLEGPSSSDTSCGFDLPSADPELGSLADNGGPTQTQALAFTSPAVDAVPSGECPASTDQRGLPRPDNGESFCDVGAYEFQDAAPAISSAASATFQVGRAGSFTVTASGSPVPKLSQSGALPTGVGFTDNGDGTATLSGTPAAGTGGSYTLTIGASNGVAPDASQSFTLTVQAPPTAAIVTPAAGVTYTVGQKVDTSFGCSEGAGGTGIASCTDQDGRSSGQPLDTSTVGQHTFTVTATSKDGLRGTTSAAYTVIAAPPKPPVLHVSIATRRTAIAHHRAKIKLRCQSQASPGVCRGKLILTVRKRIVKHVHHHRRVIHRTIVIARGRYKLHSGHTKQITVKLTSKGRHLLKAAQHRHKHRHRPRLQVQAKATLNHGHATHRTITLLLER